MCMRVVLCQMKNGRLAFVERSMASSVAARNSSSAVSIRLIVSGPVSSMVCMPIRPKRGSTVAIILVRCARLEHAAWTEALLELRVLRIVDVLRLLFRIEMIEVAEELIEAMHGRQVLVAVAEVVLAVLERHVALVLQQVGNGRVLFLKAERRARQADLEQSGTERRLAGDERGAPGGAGLLAVVVGEQRALAGDAIDVGRLVAHHALVVGAEVPVADVVAENDQDVGSLAGRRRLLRLRLRRRDRRGRRQAEHGKNGATGQQHVAPARTGGSFVLVLVALRIGAHRRLLF